MHAIHCLPILLLLQVLLSIPTNVQGSSSFWVRTWGVSSQDWGQKVVVDSLDNIFVVGAVQGNYYAYSQPNAIMKYNSTGDLLWQKTWGGPQQWDRTVRSIAVDSSGNVYATGPSVDYDNITILKLNSTGGFVWGKSWGGINASFTGLITSDIATDQAGNIFVTGITWWKSGTSHLFLLKLNSTGDVLWLKVSINDLGYGGQHLAISSDGDIYVTGQPVFYTSGPAGDSFLLKFNSSGALLWQESLGSTMPTGIDADKQGGVIVVGFVYNPQSNNGYLATVLKLDSFGVPVWQKTFEGNIDGVATDNASGRIFVTGFHCYALLMVFDLSGSLISGTKWGSEGCDGGDAIAVDSSGDPIVTGYVDYGPPFKSSTLSTPTNSTTPSVASLNASYTTMTVQSWNPEFLVQTPTYNADVEHIFLFKGIPIPTVLPHAISTSVSNLILELLGGGLLVAVPIIQTGKQVIRRRRRESRQKIQDFWLKHSQITRLPNSK